MQGTLIPAIFAFLFTTAREIIKDLEDTEGDLKNSVKTLAILHPQLAVQTAIGFMGLVILFSPIPYLFSGYSWQYLLAVVLGVDVVLIGCAIRLLRDASKESCAAIQHWMKWDIFVGTRRNLSRNLSMINYDKVIAFLERENPNATVVSRFKQAYHTFSKTGEWHPNYQVLTAGWQTFDGILLMTPNGHL